MIGLKIKMILIWLLMSFVLSPRIFAQGPPVPGDRPERREERERIRENIETLRMWKLLEALVLTSEQSTQFLPALKDFQNAKKRFEEKRRDLLKVLETTLESRKEEKKLKETLMSLEENRKQFQMEMDRFEENAKATLTLEQQAKLLLFEEKFEKRLKETIEQIRGRHSR